MSIAAYVRVSSDKQDTARQEKRIIATGLPIAYWFRDDTGKNPRDQAGKRVAFQAMLQAVSAGLVKQIIVDRQDRFGVKDGYEWGKFISLLRENGAVLSDADGKVLSGSDDISILGGMLGAITSTREQKEKAHRSTTGKVGKAKAGEYQGGLPAYGLDVCCIANGKEKWRTVYVGRFKRWRVWPDGRREQFDGIGNSPAKDPTDVLCIRPSIEKERLRVVKQIFEWFATEAISERQIGTRLNDLGVDPLYTAWNKVRILDMLRNPAYIGFPTWNKKGQGRFVEYIGGKFREAPQTQAGRRRDQSDFVAPDKPQYKPLIPEKVWLAVQRKIEASREYGKSIPRRSPDTAELFLRPFLVCGHCGGPMHGTMGRGTKYLWPSYFCGTYGKLGIHNPSGCHCHRVRHRVLEHIVKSYLAETSPKVAQLLEATDTGDLAAARPLLESLTGVAQSFYGLECDIMAFVDDHGGPPKGKDFTEAYGLLYERFRPAIEAKIQEKEAEIEKMLDEFRGLSEKQKPRLNVKMDALQVEINAMRGQLVDLREPWKNLRGQLVERQAAFATAVKILGKDGGGRRKTETLRGVISQITCWFRHTQSKGAAHNGKSFLEKVEIVPISGKKQVFSAVVTDGNLPGPC